MIEAPCRSFDDVLAQAEWLERFALRLARDADRADDLVQETYVVALEARDRPVGHLRGWLAAVARNLAWTEQRGRTRRSRRERAVAMHELVVPAEEEVGSRDVQLARALETLSEPYRSLVVQRYFEGSTPRDIARRTGVPAQVVRQHVSRGLRKLRARLVRTG